MWAASGLCRQLPADAAASQFGKASASMLPLFPGDGAQPPPEPLVKCAQHRWSLAEAEVAAPSDEIDGQLLGGLREASSARAPRQFPNHRFEAGQRLRRNAPSWLRPACEAKAQELADVRQAGFSDTEIAEIIGNVALNVLTNYFNRAAETDIDFPRVTAGQLT